MSESRMFRHTTGSDHQARVRYAEIRELEKSSKNKKSRVQSRDLGQVETLQNHNHDTLSSFDRAPSPHSPNMPTSSTTLNSELAGEPDVPEYDFFEDSTYASIQDSGEASDAVANGNGKWLPCGPFSSAFKFLDQHSTNTAVPAPVKGHSRLNPFDDTSYFPYDNLAICLTHTLFNTPSIRFSEAQQAAVLDWAKEMGTENVPSMYALQKCDQKLATLMGEMTRKFTTHQGDIYYVNDIGTMLKQDFSNSELRKHMEFYPRESDGYISEIWHGEKMLKGDNQGRLSPMASHHGQLYFVDEVSKLLDGSYFVPEMFIKHRGELSARGYRLVPRPELGPEHFAYTGDSYIEPLSGFSDSVVKLAAFHPNGITVSGDLGLHANRVTNWLQPHPLRELAAGRQVYSIPFILFVDDVLGNTSKQWNKHWCCYISNATLPQCEINRRSNIRFMSTTQHVDPIEMLNGICKMFEEAFETPVVVWDVESECEVLARPYIHFSLGDNPMQATECSTCGLQSNLLCRTCCSGGTRKFKRSDEGFAALMEAGTLQTPESTIDSINQQYQIAFTLNPSNRLTITQRVSGVKDTLAQAVFERIIQRRHELQENTNMDEEAITGQLHHEFKAESEEPARMNPLLSLKGFNVHLDTPTETLHTIPLGIVKYLWTETVEKLDQNDAFKLFSTRLQSISVSGLNCGPVPTYIINNRGSLNGKHFKFLAQTACFCLHNLVSVDLINAWTVLGRLAVLAWYPLIEDLDGYEREFKESIDDFLHALAKFIPKLIVQKAKAHLLVHMPLFVRRFGPLLGPNSERYESFNSTFRAASVHSNRQAPSRDIAKRFALFDAVKHVMSGGIWCDDQTRSYVRAGSSIIQLCESSQLIGRLLGIKREGSIPVIVNVRATSVSAHWDTFAPRGLAPPTNVVDSLDFWPAISTQAINGDMITPGSNVIFELDQSTPMLGRVYMILADDHESAKVVIVIIQLYDWVELDTTLRMPVVRLTENFQVIPQSAVSCEVNLQHRCAHIGCMDTGTVPIFQERQQTTSTRPAIAHNDEINYIINTLSFHNCLALKKLIKNRFGCYNVLIPPSEFAKIRQEAAAKVRGSGKQSKHTHSDAEQSGEDEALPTQQKQASLRHPELTPIQHPRTYEVNGNQHTGNSAPPSASDTRKRKRKQKPGQTTNSRPRYQAQDLHLDASQHETSPNARPHELLAPYVPPTLFD